MQLEALKVFCDVADLHSFSKAAEANQRTQSAVSRMLQELENRLGVQLIDRSRRTLPLTPLGQVYYEGCKRLLDQFLELETSIRHAQGQMALNVRVAAIYSVGLGDIRQHVERFEQQHPHVKVHIDYLHPSRVYERIQQGSCDLGLVSYPRASRDLTILPWREEEMVVACTPAHALARRTDVDPAMLEGEKFVAFEKGLAIRREVDRFLRRHGIGVEVVLEFDNIENIKKGIEVGAGVALLPEPTVRQEVLAGSLRALWLSGSQLCRPLGIIHRRHHRLSSSALAFIEVLQANGAAASCSGAHCPQDSSLNSFDPMPRPKTARRKRKVP
jgi:DNA-binding transcriptional LysR family regulator